MERKRVLVVSQGTRGDFQPALLFAVGLKKAGCDITFMASSIFENTVVERGLQFKLLGGNPHECMNHPLVQEALSCGDALAAFPLIKPAVDKMHAEDMLSLEQLFLSDSDWDCVVPTHVCFEYVLTLSEKYNVPVIALNICPSTPTAKFGHVCVVPGLGGESKANLDTYSLVHSMVAVPEQVEHYDSDRKRLGLQPLKNPLGYLAQWEDNAPPTIVPISPLSWKGRPEDWRANVHMTGYIRDSSPLKLDDKIEEFLNGYEDPPIFFSFGSMPSPKPKLLLDLAIAVVTKLNCRGILSAGWTSEFTNDDVPKNLLIIKEAPYPILFPRCKCIVHHCGVGTTGEVLHAGKPHVPVPFFVDQPFWAGCMYELGVASNPIKFKDLNQDNLLEAVLYVQNPDVIAKAKELGEKIKVEGDGIGAAVGAFMNEYPGVVF
eukprot:TRINITY_DN788_c0_g1_i3.p1 TRINITY_DN788_c0_g1~~TRINITY_DN788_c0_g1_i3.p1  ORF type:complete len:432 (+),score=86.60 TRINITY_DN788_c0_g1_i3:94-1389(+)